jgi:hypothetical protein
MATLELRLKARATPWGTNQDRQMDPFKRAELVTLWKTNAMLTLREWRAREQVRGPFPFTIVQMVIHFPTKDSAGRRNTAAERADPHNFCGTVLKAVVDGLVLAQAWPRDTAEYVGHRESILLTSDDPSLVRLWCEDGSEPWMKRK